jgi:hypothetical protein
MIIVFAPSLRVAATANVGGANSRDIPAWMQGPIRFAHRAQNPRINRVRYWRLLSGFLFLRRVSPDRGGRIIAALPSVNNLIAVETTYPMSNPLAQLRAEINDLAALLTSARFYFVRHI